MILLMLPLLTSCTVSSKKVEHFSSAITATRNPNFSLAKGSKVAIDPVARINLPGDPIVQQQLQQTLTQVLTAELTTMGFVVTSVMASEYMIGYAVAVDSELTDADISSMFGLAPGYSGGARQSYRRGTLLLDLHNTQSRINVWRGALQTELIDDLTVSQRNRRIEIAVGRLLRAMAR